LQELYKPEENISQNDILVILQIGATQFANEKIQFPHHKKPMRESNAKKKKINIIQREQPILQIKKKIFCKMNYRQWRCRQ
jgi:uncharacterized cupin superfamily protein